MVTMVGDISLYDCFGNTQEFSSENQVVFSQYIFINNLPGGVENLIVQMGNCAYTLHYIK